MITKEEAWNQFHTDGFFDFSNVPENDLDYLKEIFFEGFEHPTESRFAAILTYKDTWPSKNGFGQDDYIHPSNVYVAGANYAKTEV